MKKPDGWLEIPGDRAVDIFFPLLKLISERPDSSELASAPPGKQEELDATIDRLPASGNFIPLSEMSLEATALLRDKMVQILAKAAQAFADGKPFMLAPPGWDTDLHLLANLLADEIRSPRSLH